MVELREVKSNRRTPCIIFGTYGNKKQCSAKMVLPLTRLPKPTHIPDSKDHTEAWESFSQFNGPHRSVGIHHTISKTHTKALGCITPTRRATPKRRSPSSN